MRKRFRLMLAIYPALFLLSFSNLNAQVFPGSLTLTTQAEVDAFNYTEVTGILKIEESIFGNITNLNGLSELATVGGSVIFQINASLTSAGLPNLATVGGSLIFTANSSLTDIGLNSLSSIGGGLTIQFSNSLVDIDGINNLTSIGGILYIVDNLDLVNLNGLKNLISVGGNLFIEHNEILTNFCGLYTLLFNDGLSGSYNVSLNAVNPTEAEIIAAGGQAPVIADFSVSPAVLAPPNHKMKDITVNYTATAVCGPVNTVLSVSSNEPINGTGDGDTSPDWIIVDDHHVKLRAERAGTGNGRIYTITITATSLVGISSTSTVEVKVPHNKKGSANRSQKSEMESKVVEKAPIDFNVIAFPNPGTNRFAITVQCDSREKVVMKVIDMYGRVIETRNVTANSTIRFGDRYKSGIYIVRVIRGKQHKTLKLIKISD